MKMYLCRVLGLISCLVSTAGYAAQKPAAEGGPAAPAAGIDELFPDEVVAKGKGVEIRRNQLHEAFTAHKSNLAARGQPLPEDQRTITEARILERLIVVELLLNKAQPPDRTNAAVKVEKLLADYRKGLGTEEAFQRQLQGMGMTPDKFRDALLERAICDEVLDREIKSKQTISEEQTRAYYNENPTRFEQPEMVRASHILFATRDKGGKDLPAEQVKEKRALAEKVLKRAKSGEDFAKLVKEYSEDDASLPRNGEYTFPRGQMAPEFEGAAFALQPNEISDLVTTRFGYHIIKAHEKVAGSKMEYGKIQEKLKDNLLNQEVQKELPQYIVKLKKDYNLEILDPKLREASANLRPLGGEVVPVPKK